VWASEVAVVVDVVFAGAEPPGGYVLIEGEMKKVFVVLITLGLVTSQRDTPAKASTARTVRALRAGLRWFMGGGRTCDQGWSVGVGVVVVLAAVVVDGVVVVEVTGSPPGRALVVTLVNVDFVPLMTVAPRET
jgi:hypothetical protein